MHSAIESLEAALDRVDFAIFICNPEDSTTTKHDQRTVVRDNVVFELGLFLGRLTRKRVFTIGPRGAKGSLPSDLTGYDPESYDPSIEALETALGPACDVIRKKIKTEGQLRLAPDNQEPQSEPTSRDESVSELIPKSDWTIRNYEFAIFMSILRGHDDKAAEIDTAFLASDLATREAVAEWRAYQETLKQEAEKQVNLQVIHDAAKAFPDNLRIARFLARTLAGFGEFDDALELFQQGVKNASMARDRARAIDQIVSISDKALNPPATPDLRKLLLEGVVENDEDRLEVAETMSKIAAKSQLPKISSAIAEHAISLEPDNRTSRFELAYAYSESGHNELSLFHYKQIPEQDRAGGDWNNLGVSYSRLDIKGLAIDAFSQSATDNNAIAEGNLASKEVEAGFYQLAEQRLKRVSAAGLESETLRQAATELAEARKKDAAAEEKALATARNQRAMQLRIGRAAILPEQDDIIGTWTTPQGLIEIARDHDGIYRGRGEWAKEEGVVQALLARTKYPRKSQVTVTLTRFGNAFEGMMKIDDEDTTTILGRYPEEIALLLALNVTTSQLEGVHTSYGESQAIWRRAEAAFPIGLPTIAQ